MSYATLGLSGFKLGSGWGVLVASVMVSIGSGCMREDGALTRRRRFDRVRGTAFGPHWLAASSAIAGSVVDDITGLQGPASGCQYPRADG